MKYMGKERKEKIDNFLYKILVIYIGTFCMMAGPFFVNTVPGKITCITGLALLSVQTQRTKSYNLTALNIVGICGYLYSIFS